MPDSPDLVRFYRESRTRVVELVSDLVSGELETPVPGSVYAGHRFIDVFIHGWDLARATGQDPSLDPELVAACTEVLEPQLAMLQGSGLFGTPVEVPARADAQTRLLASLGRHP